MNISPAASSSYYNPALSVFSKLLPLATLVLIMAGALVTSHQAGLSVPDWPTTYGENMFTFPFEKWVGGIFFEHGHRLIASGIGLLTVILTFWIQVSESRRWVKVLSLALLAAVILQGVLGGITVLYKLPTAVSVSHAVLAQTFLILSLCIAYSESRDFVRVGSLEITSSNARTLFTPALTTTVIIYIQLILGALMRHTYSGLAIPDFPTMGNSLWPTFDDAMLSSINELRAGINQAPVMLSQVLIHFAHRVGAVAVVIAVAFLVFKARNVFPRLTSLISIVVLFQFVLGILTVLSVKEPYLTSLHVVTGALALGLSTLLTLRAYRMKIR